MEEIVKNLIEEYGGVEKNYFEMTKYYYMAIEKRNTLARDNLDHYFIV